MTRVAIALILTLAASSPTRAEDARPRVFVGYVFGSTKGIDYRLYTHLFHAFLVPDADGNVRPGGRGVPGPEFVAEAHKAGVKVGLSLGGWGFDAQFLAIATHPEAETRFVDAVLKTVREADYDGIDLDWEYPDTAAEIVGFERLTRRLRAGLDAIGKAKGRHEILTMAASSNPGTLRWLDKAFLLETMDWVNVMTYDYAGDWSDHAGHNAPLHASTKPGASRLSTELSLKYLVEQKGMPADRLVVGIPLYGHGFAVAEPYAPTKGIAKKRLPQGDYRNLRKLPSEGWTRTWDDEIKAPWLLAPDHSAVFGYDDAESVALKAAWGIKGGYRGVFFWQVGGDRLDDGTHPLQEAARKEWEKKPGGP